VPVLELLQHHTDRLVDTERVGSLLARLGSNCLRPADFRCCKFSCTIRKFLGTLCEAVVSAERLSFKLAVIFRKIYQCHCSLSRKQGGSSSNSAIIVEARNFCWIAGQQHISSYGEQQAFVLTSAPDAVLRSRTLPGLRHIIGCPQVYSMTT
jgi:hypothetical protein